MNLIKRYVNNLVRNITEDIIQEKADLIIKQQLSCVPRSDIKNYQIKLNQAQPDFWNTLRTQSPTELSIRIVYLDENNRSRDFKKNFYTLKELYDYVSLDFQGNADDDIVSIEKIALWFRHTYKGKKELESHNFTDFNKNYRPESVQDAFITIKQWVEKYPELLL